ncbi:RimJ/RimL family protein N-acetyltransferase [Kribbella aluminosa]|uniref:RimJ/RimL family protein N-acetyltransferase n=1 Tax=Kribbella aluminosa TaxID=416017 RepID=A0ABS4UIJ8_9ACTN|nr:GNAT family protein [Kribbella aluminosa]MBP2351483.1 RimJ/RimL family protein N-acetyltransferase [Kribbella aluminosa]
MDVTLRPVVEDDLPLFQRFAVEPGLIGLDWNGYRDPQSPVRRFAEDGFLGKEDGRLTVRTGSETAGFVSWHSGSFDGRTPYWEIGIALLPEYRGRGIGWRAQATLTAYLFEHTPVQRIQAATHPENIAEQKSLEKAGFRLEGVIRGCEFRAGKLRDGYLYSRLRDDPEPELGNGSVTGTR